MTRRPPSFKQKLTTLLRRTGIVLGLATVLAALRTLIGGRQPARSLAVAPPQAAARPHEAAKQEQGADERGGFTTIEKIPYEEKWVPTTRRKFLLGLSIAAGGLGGAIVSVPVIGFLLSPVIRERVETWRSVGTTDDFPIGSTTEVTFRDAEQLAWAGFAAQTAAWLRRDDEQNFTAFSVYCTHTGCPVRWLEDARLFVCPCHGGVFERDGSVTAGPPTAPLARYDVRVRDRQVEIQAGPIPIPGTERTGQD
jgi:menaquinol-cytochrome c reductase iron-sulfur subunit